MTKNPSLPPESILLPPLADPTKQYELLWKGTRNGGTLYITMEAGKADILYCVLDVPGDDSFVGYASIPQGTSLTVEQIVEVVLTNFDAMYNEAQVVEYEFQKSEGSVRIQ